MLNLKISGSYTVRMVTPSVAKIFPLKKSGIEGDQIGEIDISALIVTGA